MNLGFPALLALAVRDQLASLPLSELVVPAVELARNGWKMDEGLYKSIHQYAPQLARDPASRELFLDASATKPRSEVGEILSNPQLADTLEFLADQMDPKIVAYNLVLFSLFPIQVYEP